MLGKRIISALLALVLLLGNVPVGALAAEEMPLEEPVVLTEEVTETTIAQTSPPETAAPTQVLEIPELETTAAAEEILVPVVLCDHGKEMAVCNLCSGIQLTADDGTTVTRAEWLRQLTVTFEMAIEEGHYPDNYFSDLPSDSAYYYDVLLAVEFGVVDIPAGGAVRPEDPTTREFAAQTLNYCLGFQFEGTSYTFSDAALCTYPDDAQIAIDREWFALMDGAFCPEASITTAEMEIMLADAAQIYATQEIDPEFESSYVFADYVIEYPYGTDVEIDENGIVTLYNVEQVLSSGDTFVVYPTELPALYKAVKVSGDANVLTVTTTEADEASAVVSINAEGTADMDISQFEAGEGVEAMYIQNEADVALAMETYGITVSQGSVVAEKDIKLSNGITAKVVFNIANIKLNTRINTLQGNYYVTVSGDTTLTGSVSVDAIKETIGKSKVTLGTAKVAGVGTVTVSAELALNGKIVLTYTGGFEAGVQRDSSGFRLVKTFYKKTFSTVVEANASVGLRADFGIDIIAAKANIYILTGVEGHFVSNTYGDGQTPKNCTNIKAWLFAKTGASATVGIGDWSKTWSKDLVIYNEGNSPARISFHYEDQVRVSTCTRGQTSYTTADDSPYGGSSYGGGSSTGTDSSGNEYTIYTYTLDSKNNATITGYNGKSSVLSIPETIDGYTVTAIGDSSFSNKKTLYAITIPDTVTTIGHEAFEYCTNLQTILIPDSVTFIGSEAFRKTGLTSLRLPSNLEKLWEDVLDETPGVMQLLIPKTVTSMASSLRGSYVKKLTFEEGMTTIPSHAAYEARTLKEVVIPDTVTSIGNSAFYLCVSLESIQIPNSVTTMGTSVFNRCHALKQVSLPNKLTIIEDCMFEVCYSLTSITIPSTVQRIDAYAFQQCSALKEIVWSSSLQEIGYEAFRQCTSLVETTLPDSVTKIDTGAFDFCSNLTSIALSSNLTEIPRQMFESCTKLTSIVIPGMVTTIGSKAFKNCNSLAEIYMPQSVTSVDTDSFAITMGDAVERTVYGVSSSYAQEFANKYSYHFVVIQPTNAPKTPTAVNVLASGKPKLTWKAVTGAKKYLVYRADSSNGSYSLMGTVTKCTYTDASAAAGKLYYYYVAAMSENGLVSSPSSTVSRTCDLPRPTGIKVTNDPVTGKNKITWKAVPGAAKYQVWYSETGKTGSFKVLMTTKNLSHIHKGAEAGKLYYYKVKALHTNTNAHSALTGAFQRTCDLGRPNVTASNVASTGKIKLSWPKVAGAVKYEIWRGATKNGTYTRISTIKGTSFVATGTNAGKAYYYKIKAIHSNANANSAFSLPDLRTCDLARPVVTAGNNATTGKVRLTWKAIPGAAKYQVWYSATGKANTFKCVWTTKNLYFNHNASKVGVKGYYKVKAIHTNTAANSAYSTVVSRAAK